MQELDLEVFCLAIYKNKQAEVFMWHLVLGFLMVETMLYKQSLQSQLSQGNGIGMVLIATCLSVI